MQSQQKNNSWQLKLFVGIGGLALVLTLVAAILPFFAGLVGRQRYSVATNRLEAATTCTRYNLSFDATVPQGKFIDSYHKEVSSLDSPINLAASVVSVDGNCANNYGLTFLFDDGQCIEPSARPGLCTGPNLIVSKFNTVRATSFKKLNKTSGTIEFYVEVISLDYPKSFSAINSARIAVTYVASSSGGPPTVGGGGNACTTKGGVCMNPASCKGTVLNGLCPGGQDNKCCVSGGGTTSQDPCVKAYGSDWELQTDKTPNYCLDLLTGDTKALPSGTASACQTDKDCNTNQTCILGKCVTKSGSKEDTSGGGLENLPGVDLTIQGLSQTVYGFVCWLWSISIALAVIALIWVGLRMMYSQANATAFGDARKAFVHVLVGAMVIMGVYVIIATVANVVGAKISFVPFSCSVSQQDTGSEGGNPADTSPTCDVQTCSDQCVKDARSVCDGAADPQACQNKYSKTCRSRCLLDCESSGANPATNPEDNPSSGSTSACVTKCVNAYHCNALSGQQAQTNCTTRATSLCQSQCGSSGSGSTTSYQLCGSSAVSGNASSCIPSSDCNLNYCYDASGSSACGSTKFPSANCRRDKNGNPIP